MADLSSSIVEIFNFPHIEYNIAIVATIHVQQIYLAAIVASGGRTAGKVLVSCEVESSFMMDSSSSIEDIFDIPHSRYIEDADVNEYMSNKHLAATVCLQGSNRGESASSATRPSLCWHQSGDL